MVFLAKWKNNSGEEASLRVNKESCLKCYPILFCLVLPCGPTLPYPTLPYPCTALSCSVLYKACSFLTCSLLPASSTPFVSRLHHLLTAIICYRVRSPSSYAAYKCKFCYPKWALPNKGLKLNLTSSFLCVM